MTEPVAQETQLNAPEPANPWVPNIDEDPYSYSLEELNVSQPELFEKHWQYRYFERLRKEAPVHFCPDGEFGPYWSLTKYEDILAVDRNHQAFSSYPNIVYQDPLEDFKTDMFIAMDPPKHDEQRKEVQGVVGPANLKVLQHEIRERVCSILDSLPVGEEFDWVDKVSIELTTQMLATLFDFPFEDRRLLTYWSDITTARVEPGGLVESDEERQGILLECLAYFTRLFHERKQKAPGNDLVSMLAHGESTKDSEPMEFLGNLMLLIVGGNDTTRNSISGGVLALNQYPEEYQKLRENHDLIPNMVSEVIRWQTPLAYMKRRTVADTVVGGQKIREGDKVLMWYASGNRDEEMFEDA
ncbi:MAG: cytochrome P450, partial [Acidobacteriota bacterium]